MPTDEQIATAFNAGYTMQQHDPAMVEKLTATDSKESEIVQSLVKGAEKSLRDKIKRQQQQIKERQQNKTHKR